MDQKLADDVAPEYEQWSVSGDRSVLTHFSPDFVDHVSGQRGLTIFDVVAAWLDESFADRRVEHHAAMFDGDRVMVWYTAHGRHVGNGFPRMADLLGQGRTSRGPSCTSSGSRIASWSSIGRCVTTTGCSRPSAIKLAE